MRGRPPHPSNRSRKPPPLADGLSARLAELKEKTGYTLRDDQKAIPDAMSFREWCEKLGREGLKVDGRRFRLDNRPAMAWIYDQIPTTADDAYRLILVLMKCAQVGFTVMEILAAIYLGLKFGSQLGNANVGMFLPDINLASIKSTERFMPIVRSIPDVHALMTQEAADGSGRTTGEGSVTRRRIAEALYLFAWTSGRAMTESVPMEVLCFDEVQEMSISAMEKALERLSASELRFVLMGSTANWPESDIDHWYRRGSRHRFHTECQTCGARKPLDDYFPACIKFDEELDRWRYVCEAGHWIDDTQRGEWIAENPAADPPIDLNVRKLDRPLRIRSIHFHQMLSPTISAGEFMDAYTFSESMKNFYNRKLGKPFMDPSLVPVTMEHMKRCVAEGAKFGVKWKKRAQGTFMGIDQMGGFNAVIIKERLPDGRQAVVHLEEVYGEDPFARCDELMAQYGVQCCVLEINPNYNEAKRFANRHPGRVHICDSFGALEEGMIRWGDAPKLDVSERRTSEDDRDRYTVKVDQYKTMQVAFSRFTSIPPHCLWPNPNELVQEVIDKKVKSFQPVAPRAFVHFTKTALVVEKVDEADPDLDSRKKRGKAGGTNRVKRSVQKIGLDPHFSYANQLCDVAWARAHGTATFVFAEGPTAAAEQREKAEAMEMHGLPNHVVALMSDLPEGVCGRCSAFPFGDDDGPPAQGECAERGFSVSARDPGCPFFNARESS